VLLTDLVTAFMLLTRLPVARFVRPGVPPDLARCIWAFPIVGLAVGAVGGLVYWLAHKLGMPPLVAAAWTLGATLITTGAIHEDGLADTADGFAGGATPARKIEIMRDSRIGSYGALGLLLSLILRASAIAALDRPRLVLIAMVLAGMLGRSGMLVFLLALKPARDEGMGASVAKPPAWSAALGMGFAIAAPALLLPVQPAIAAVILGLGSCLAVARLAYKQIGGHTGDVLGAGELVSECVVLTAIASASMRM
jgi:adenosylcobinamide-GDP ribazoletransferase